MYTQLEFCHSDVTAQSSSMSLQVHRLGSSHYSGSRQLFPLAGTWDTSAECDLVSLRLAGRELTFGFKGKETGGERTAFLGTS